MGKQEQNERLLRECIETQINLRDNVMERLVPALNTLSERVATPRVIVHSKTDLEIRDRAVELALDACRQRQGNTQPDTVVRMAESIYEFLSGSTSGVALPE